MERRANYRPSLSEVTSVLAQAEYEYVETGSKITLRYTIHFDRIINHANVDTSEGWVSVYINNTDLQMCDRFVFNTEEKYNVDLIVDELLKHHLPNTTNGGYRYLRLLEGHITRYDFKP